MLSWAAAGRVGVGVSLSGPGAPPRRVAAFLCMLLSLFGFSEVLSAQGQLDTLPLVLFEEAGAPSEPWWVRRDLRQSEVEASLAGGLSSRGVRLMDPGGLSEAPKVSRIYRVERLSRANAVNLAGLYGARQALIGRVATKEIEGPAGLAGGESVASLVLVEVPSGDVLLDVRFSRRAFDERAEVARDRALGRLIEDLGASMATSLKALSPPVGIAREEPALRVGGLWDKGSLSRFEAALAAQPGVEALKLVWATEGSVAFDLNPAKVEAASWVETVADALCASPPEGVALRRAARVGSDILLRAERARPEEEKP